MIPRFTLFDLDDEGPSDAWSRWGRGIAIPAMIAMSGASRFFFRHVELTGRYGRRLSLDGWDAVASACVVLAVALFMNSHYYLPHTKRVAEYAPLGKVVALLTGIFSIGFIVVRHLSVI